MSHDLETRFHTEWLGLVQPVEGLVVSVPVLAEAQCMRRQPLDAHQRFVACTTSPDDGAAPRRLDDLTRFLADILDWTPELYDTRDALPDDLALYVPEGHQTLRPTLALRQRTAPETPTHSPAADDSTPASRAGADYVALLWDLPPGLPLDKPETTTGPWEYPPAAKFDRLLRACRVPIGVLTNREVVRLVYAPHGESSGHITFRVDDMAAVAGRTLFDAFVMLLGAERFFGVAPQHQLPALLRDSRTRQANVTNELAEQMLDAIHVLLAGFVAAAQRDGSTLLDQSLQRDDDHVYQGLLTVLLRLVFALYAEDRALLPVDHPDYAQHLSVLGLFEQLQRDHGEWPDSMGRRFGAWARLVALFRAIFLGVQHGALVLPARRGELFDPHRFPFLEGWGPDGAAPLVDRDAMGRVRVPTVDDATVYTVLHRLLLFQGQRLSYRALDVEQIGAVYEALMGFHVVRLSGPALCLKGQKGARVWVESADVLKQAPAQRAAWVADTAALAKSAVARVADALKAAQTDAEVLAALDGLRVKGSAHGRAGQLVVQPGNERRRTSSHYTPPSLTAPIVRRTLEPLLAAMGPEPASERLLQLKVCDPAMGSGAFLVEACRFLADVVVAAWTREGRLDLVASAHGDVVLHARRLVAQRCLYGVDKNPLAVSLARLSLWLVTLARDEPFTFVDHALRHGDALVGLDLPQIRAFHWKPGPQGELAGELIDTALEEALAARQRILALAAGDDTRAKEHLLWDANDALAPVRLLGDLVVGAFFAETKDKAREAERKRRLDLVVQWLESRQEPPEELLALQRDLRERVPAFHWGVEFPEVFYGERPDPLDGDRVNRVAWMDAFVGNPPFMGGSTIWPNLGGAYRDWLLQTHQGSHGNGDLCAHFLRRCALKLGMHGVMGFVLTNTAAQGDTRSTGLLPLLQESGFKIYSAISSMPWDGEAAVAVSVVHLAIGAPKAAVKVTSLDGRPVAHIDSRLRAAQERSDSSPLMSNRGIAHKGATLYGLGFLVDSAERAELVSADPRNDERLMAYVGGEDLNSSPGQSSGKYAIYLTDLSLPQAEAWPDLLGIVRARVKPERDLLGGYSVAEARRENWWKYGTPAFELRGAVSGMKRFIATSRISKHLCFSFVGSGRIMNDKTYCFALGGHTQFALLQSRVHEKWVRLLSSTLEDRLNYSASDCFETFPFPQPDPRAVIPALEDIGERLYTARAAYMVETQQGLTQTYNALKDARVHDRRVVALRRLHEEMDRAVLAAYGWDDLEVPVYGGATTEGEKQALSRFEDAVIDRLFALNATRAAEERAAAAQQAATAGAAKAKGGGGRKKKGDAGSGGAGSGQGTLGIG